jgi:hypothetical protein
VTILLVIILVGVAMWGQYWYDRAKRLQDAIAFMVDEEVNDD